MVHPLAAIAEFLWRRQLGNKLVKRINSNDLEDGVGLPTLRSEEYVRQK